MNVFDVISFFLVSKAIQSAILKVTNLLVSKADP